MPDTLVKMNPRERAITLAMVEELSYREQKAQAAAKAKAKSRRR